MEQPTLTNRQTRVAAGAAALQQHLTDTLHQGLATTENHWPDLAARMVDAQAPGLATRVRNLDNAPRSSTAGKDWPDRLLEEYALLHLLATAYQRRDTLPEPLAATVRTHIGFTTESAQVLAAGPLLRDHWLVLGTRDSSEDERLTTRRTWLLGAQSHRTALLLGFARHGQAPPGPELPPGHTLDADLAYYPAARPLRAVLGEAHSAPYPHPTAPPGRSLDEALADYAEVLRADPWADSHPTVLRGVIPHPTPTGWHIIDAEATTSIPLDRRHTSDSGLWRLTAVSGGHPLTVFGETGHRGFAPVTAWTTTGTPVTVHH